MNPLKKIYCRIFQTAFKLALPLLPYRNPKILGSVKEIPALLEKKNCNTVLLITDGSASQSASKRLWPMPESPASSTTELLPIPLLPTSRRP